MPGHFYGDEDRSSFVHPPGAGEDDGGAVMGHASESEANSQVVEGGGPVRTTTPTNWKTRTPYISIRGRTSRPPVAESLHWTAETSEAVASFRFFCETPGNNTLYRNPVWGKNESGYVPV